MSQSLPTLHDGFEEPLAGNYFISAYPPFSCWKKDHVPQLESKLDAPLSAAGDTPLGLYVHLPFCDVRCMYCYYFSHANKSPELIEDYIDALVKELALYRDKPALAHRDLGFVYFGGGTPSILSEIQIHKLITKLKALFPWAAVKEATFECAPKSVTEPKLRALREGGITRISMGVQQLDDAILKQNGRVHLVSDVKRAYAIIRRFDFEVVNIDLMVGLLGESDESFMESLERIIKMNPDSVTIYQLELPLNTPLYRVLDKSVPASSLATWEVKRSRLANGFARLEAAGYQLRSAYTAARSPKPQRFVYQDAQYHGADLLGIGASAFSYIDGIHCQNLTSLESYLQRLGENRLAVERAYVLNDDERLIREFVLQLKLGRVDGSDFRAKFRIEIFARFADPLAHVANQGLLIRNGNELALTREGLLRVDRMLPAFYLPEHQHVRYS
jgi:oxygen-independent coproporphyrinogen-3 oxidase